eukprot:4755802-Heterocapsa_arctica.AAC.1
MGWSTRGSGPTARTTASCSRGAGARRRSWRPARPTASSRRTAPPTACARGAPPRRLFSDRRASALVGSGVGAVRVAGSSSARPRRCR